jgi:hypothetical protein
MTEAVHIVFSTAPTCCRRKLDPPIAATLTNVFDATSVRLRCARLALNRLDQR